MAILYVTNGNEGKHMEETYTLSAQSWNNGKFGVGKLCRTLCLGMSYSSIIQDSYPLALPGSQREQDWLREAEQRRGKYKTAAYWKGSEMLRTIESRDLSDGIKYSHVPNNKTPTLYLKPLSLNCPLQLTHGRGMPAVFQRTWAKKTDFSPKEEVTLFHPTPAVLKQYSWLNVWGSSEQCLQNHTVLRIKPKASYIRAKCSTNESYPQFWKIIPKTLPECPCLGRYSPNFMDIRSITLYQLSSLSESTTFQTLLKTSVSPDSHLHSRQLNKNKHSFHLSS